MVPLPEALKTLMGRLETFLTPHTVPKRRASNTKKKTPASVSWPHKNPNPEELAFAGFYYKPSADNIDNVQCLVCNSQLDGWDPIDVPAYEHLLHAPECGWAINACIRLRLGDPNRVEEDPMSEKMIESRRATYMESWPHEDKKGWKPKIQKMIEAGWCYDPSPDADDGASCHYCHLALDGWEPKDNPLTEHRRRSPECLFFALVDEYAATRQPASKKKAKGSRTSRASRLSTQSNLTSFSEAPSLMSIDADEAMADVDDSVMTNATNATSKGRKAKAPAKTTRKTTRGKKAASTSGSINLDDFPAPPEDNHGIDTDEAMADIDDSNMTNATTTKGKKGKAKLATKKTTRGKKAASTLESIILDESAAPMENHEMDVDEAVAHVDDSIMTTATDATTGKGRKGKAKAPAKTTRKTTRGKKAASTSEPIVLDEPAVTTSMDWQLEALQPSEHDSPTPKRGAKRMSNGTKKTDSPIAILEDQPETAEAPTPLPKRVKKTLKKAQTPRESSSDVENKPPSARPASVRPPLSERRGVFESPSKRAAGNAKVGGFGSSMPWKPIDLENVFVFSPSVPTLDMALDKENFFHVSGEAEVAKVREGLTEAERGMSVEEWIVHNAERGEQILRAECERKINVFEIEGGKALLALEGIQCTV
ncbi:inhibitor of apoptosis repeat-containing protein [Lophium mytilinum]|uniref:Inhibitor of apoptosis repeat-containing protein n=1 Tax=Lophium mytilinum TaxID=390894 RepID=A0A6A6QLU7_9PEZI|nr:inhibitor of apoptosis repeat-containing protein [Lophium mytilinum]